MMYGILETVYNMPLKTNSRQQYVVAREQVLNISGCAMLHVFPNTLLHDVIQLVEHYHFLGLLRSYFEEFMNLDGCDVFITRDAHQESKCDYSLKELYVSPEL